MDNFGSALFFDYGNQWPNYTYFRFKQIATDVGFGFRYYTSVAPFRLDFGYKLSNPLDTTPILHRNFIRNIEINFGIGEAF
jgi:outer membrane translocation and assembly module TamA